MTTPPAAEMSASGIPGRGIEYAKPVEHDGTPAIEALCDCGTITILTLDPGDLAALDKPVETAYTCGSCQSSHWLTVFPVQVSRD